MSLKDEFLRLLREDEEFRLAVIGLLGLDELVKAVRTLIDEVRALRADVNRLWEENNKLWQEVRRLSDNQERLLEENNKLWQEVRRINENVERLWQEVKALREGQEELRRGQESIRADINALRADVSNLKEGQNELRTEVNRLWEENRRINENIERLWQENHRLWEENSKIWQEIKRINDNIERLWQEFRAFKEEQNKFNKWMLSALMEIRDSLGGAYEYYTAHWIERWLEGKGVHCDVKANVTIPVDGSREIDAICYDPLVVGEATIKVNSIEEAEGEIAKLLENAKAAERFFNRKTTALILAVENAPEQVAEYLRRRTSELGIILVLGREYS